MIYIEAITNKQKIQIGSQIFLLHFVQKISINQIKKMQSQLKAKTKIQTQKSLTYLSNILSTTSQLRPVIDQQAQQIANQRIQTIHKLQFDAQFQNKPFICTQFNRHKLFPKSYRSPYTNNYFPSTEQGNTYPSPILRDLEQKGNILFQEYVKLYYGEQGAVANFYVYETEEGINVVFVLRKEYSDEAMKGIWCSTNFCQIRGDPLKSAAYKLMTSVLYELQVKLGQTDDFSKVSGSLRKNKADAKKPMQQYEIDEFHLMTVGKLIEQNQILLRQQLQSVFLAKSKQLCFKSRFVDSKQTQQRKIAMGKQYVKLRGESNRIVE